MLIMRFLLRKSVKSLLGMIMIALGVLVISVGISQVKASDTTAATLESSFDTVAVISGKTLIDQEVRYISSFYPPLDMENSENIAKWTADMAESHPDVIKKVSQNGLASAYIRDAAPLSYYTDGYTWDHIYAHTYSMLSDVIADVTETPQSHAMLEVTLDEIGIPYPQTSLYPVIDSFPPQSSFQDAWEWLSYERSVELQAAPTECVIVELSCTITRVLSLEEGFKDPTGMTLRFILSARSDEEMDAILSTLEEGGQCLVYGLDYYDTDWEIRQEVEIDEWDLSRLRLTTDEEKALWQKNAGFEVYATYGSHWFTKYTYDKINTVTLTGNLTGYNRIRHEPIRDEDGDLVEIREITEWTITDPSGESITVTAEEYGEYYKIPCIAPLEGTVEEFLATEAGAIWLEALERDAVNDHAFPVIGVDDLGYVAQFAFGDARIVEGREFTKEELASGARVCVISQELASANGLTVGDTIHPNFYSADENLPYQSTLAENKGLIDPYAGIYFSSTPLLGELEYTIVGIYRCDEPWAVVTDVENHYAFTPNTIFAPKASIPSKMQYSQLLQFQTVVIHNGQLESFTELMNRAGFGDCFLLTDQGYSSVSVNFADYQALSRSVLHYCIAAYAVIAILYLLLFPGSQRKTMELMQNMGAGPGKRWIHVFLSSLTLLIPATLLGAGAGYLLWDRIIEKMRSSVNVLVEIGSESGWLLTAALGQFVLMTLLSALVATIQARSLKLTKRR